MVRRLLGEVKENSLAITCLVELRSAVVLSLLRCGRAVLWSVICLEVEAGSESLTCSVGSRSVVGPWLVRSDGDV